MSTHGRIEIDCTLCGARVSVPVLTVDGVEQAAAHALELSLYHRTRHHEREGGSDPTAARMAAQVAADDVQTLSVRHVHEQAMSRLGEIVRYGDSRQASRAQRAIDILGGLG